MPEPTETLTLLVIAIPLFILVHLLITYLETGSIPSFRRQLFWVKRTQPGSDIEFRAEVKSDVDKKRSYKTSQKPMKFPGRSKAWALYELDQLKQSNDPHVTDASRIFF